jgi:hypothetical protein
LQRMSRIRQPFVLRNQPFFTIWPFTQELWSYKDIIALALPAYFCGSLKNTLVSSPL